MLKKINEGGVESSQGFSIQIIAPEIIKYTYKNCSVELDISYDSKTRKIFIYATEINTWSKENNNIPMHAYDKNLMIQNIKEAVKLLNGDFEIV